MSVVPVQHRAAVEIRGCLVDPQLEVMTFLNDVIAQYPEAISFAPGRPLDALVETEACQAAALDAFLGEASRRAGHSRETVATALAQYSRVGGIIADAIAAQLRVDEAINVTADDVVVTVGAQEAMALVLAGLFEPGRDLLLVSDPTYIGITGLARLLGIGVVPIASSDDGLSPSDVERAIVTAQAAGRVRALYHIPDFNNPLGTAMPIADRLALLEICDRHDLLLIEDNAYGMYAYDAPRPPTLKALDRSGRVLYIGSFAKTLSPGLRVGYVVAGQDVEGRSQTLASALSLVKSLITVNTPPLPQAIVAGMLLRAGGSLEPIVAPKRARYRAQRDALAAALARAFEHGPSGVEWRVPAGGFFLPLTLPFAFGTPDVRACAVEHGVIVTPMEYFAIGTPRRRQVRLAFSSVEPATIQRGVARLAEFVARRSSMRVSERTTMSVADCR